MSIVVSCRCGKRFKAKDSMAGKKVRCPGCKEPLRIPGGSSRGAAVGAGPPPRANSDAEAVDAEAALLKFEEARKRKAMTAEEEADYRQEQNKLIESYDQVTGRSGKNKKKKGALAEVGVKKVTIFTKIADVFGTIFGNLLVKYVIIAAVAGGAVYGSVTLVQKVTGYMAEETGPQKPKQERIRDLYKEIDAAIAAKKFSEARSMLDEIIRLDPSKEMNRNYTTRKKRLEDAVRGK